MTAPLLTDPQAPGFVAGYKPNWSDFDNWIQAPLQFLTSKVVFRAQCQGSFTAPAGTGAVPPFGSVDGDILEDPYGGWSTAETAFQPAYSWLCPPGCSGWFEVSCNCWYANTDSETANVIVNCYVSGAGLQNMCGDSGADGQPGGSGGTLPVPMMGGVDYVYCTLFSAATSLTSDTTAGQLPTMEITWISM